MGAPSGHPFFGNQYTDAGYKLGSFTYEALAQVADAIKAVSEEIVKNTVRKPAKAGIGRHLPRKLKLRPVKAIETGGLSKGQAIALGIIGASAIVGGYFTFKYIHNKNRMKEESQQSVVLCNAGTCISCGKPLDGSVFRPGSKTGGMDGAYIICKNCGEKNFARYPDGGSCG